MTHDQPRSTPHRLFRAARGGAARRGLHRLHGRDRAERATPSRRRSPGEPQSRSRNLRRGAFEAQKSAERLAGTPVFQKALLHRDRAILAGFIADSPHLRLESGRLRIGTTPACAAERRVQIVGTNGSLGELIAAIPLNSLYLDHLATVAGIPSDEKLVLAQQDSVLRSASLSSGGADAERERNRECPAQRQGLPDRGLAPGHGSRLDRDCDRHSRVSRPTCRFL